MIPVAITTHRFLASAALVVLPDPTSPVTFWVHNPAHPEKPARRVVLDATNRKVPCACPDAIYRHQTTCKHTLAAMAFQARREAAEVRRGMGGNGFRGAPEAFEPAEEQMAFSGMGLEGFRGR